MGWYDVLTKRLRSITESVSELKRPSLAPVKRAFETENLVVVLGAGVSRPYRVPTWDELLQGLLIGSLPLGTGGGNPVTLAKLFTTVFRPSPLIAARYLRLAFGREASPSFEDRVRDVLYADTVVADSATMKEIRQMCAAPSKSPTLDCIITYNFDDVLERCLSNLEIEIPFTSIYSVGQMPERGAIPIYHVHGFLPRDGALRSAHRITLSEDVYHEQYSDVYSWNNMIPINKFREKTCLFIGTSFSDPNLRRLLDIAYKQRGRPGIHHYLLKARYSREDVEEKLRSLPDVLKTQLVTELAATHGAADDNAPHDPPSAAVLDSEPLAEALVALMQRFEERDLESFGVGIIWVDTHDEIADALRLVRKRDAAIS